MSWALFAAGATIAIVAIGIVAIEESGQRQASASIWTAACFLFGLAAYLHMEGF